MRPFLSWLKIFHGFRPTLAGILKKLASWISKERKQTLAKEGVTTRFVLVLQINRECPKGCQTHMSRLVGWLYWDILDVQKGTMEIVPSDPFSMLKRVYSSNVSNSEFSLPVKRALDLYLKWYFTIHYLMFKILCVWSYRGSWIGSNIFICEPPNFECPAFAQFRGFNKQGCVIRKNSM